MTTGQLAPAAVPLRELSDLVRANSGLHFTPQQWPQLAKGLDDAAQELGLASSQSLAQRLLSGADPQLLDTLIRHLTIGETYFFREPAALDVFSQKMLPDLIAERRSGTRQIKIWSAACCTGEEPYTLALLLRGVLPDWRDWHFSIMGTDINRDFLDRAQRGIYRDWSFRATPEARRDLYFTSSGPGQYSLRPDIREMVRFSYLNLAATDYPSPLNNTNNVDIIFCRNVLIYLSAETATQVARRFFNALNDGGWLVVSPSEASPTLSAAFETLTFPGAIIYRKPRAAMTARTAPAQAPTRRRTTAPLVEPVAAAPRPMLRPTPAAPAPKPAEADDYARRARRAADSGQLDAALRCCQAAIAADKVQPGLYYLLATILLEQGQTEAALTALRRVLFLDHDFVAAYFALGNLALQGGRSAEARKHLGTVRTLLAASPADAAVPELDEMTAGRLAQLAGAMISNLEGAR